jgi:hypothetical protein
VVINSNEIFNSFYLIKPVIKINFIKNEIINNLPKINISENYLFIHIRSGDAFKNKKPHKDYAQPPLCFYISILQNYKFQKVYILSENNNNPNINKLINKFPNIEYKEKSLKEDISLLINAYNIVVSMSSFVISIIQLNQILSIYGITIYIKQSIK